MTDKTIIDLGGTSEDHDLSGPEAFMRAALIQELALAGLKPFDRLVVISLAQADVLLSSPLKPGVTLDDAIEGSTKALRKTVDFLMEQKKEVVKGNPSLNN